MNENDMIVIVTDPETKLITGLIDANIDGKYPDNCVQVIDKVAIDTITKHFFKAPSLHNFQNDLFYVDGKVSEKPNISAVKELKINELYKMCTASCANGFKSSALGSVYEYPSKELDQRNIHAQALASALAQSEEWSTMVWCSNKGVWNMVPHSTLQIQKLLTDMVAFIDERRIALKQKVDQINTIPDSPSFNTVIEVRSVLWDKT